MVYDVAIAGGGVMGLATAYALLKRGVQRVVVLEKHHVGHDRAASTDNTKAIRYEYGPVELYSRMVGRSIELWRVLEAETDRDLYVDCGVVCWGRSEASHAQQSFETVSRLGVSIEEVSPTELCRRYPQFALADLRHATINREGGFLRASDCVAAFMQRIQDMGGEIREGAAFAGLDGNHSRVQIALEQDGTVEAHRAVFTVGPWAANVLPRLGLKLPLTAHKQQVVYVDGLGAEFAPGHFPVFLNLDHDFYGFPLDAEGLLKASIHLPGPLIDPDVPEPPDREFTERIVSLLRTYIPGAAEGRVTLNRVCMYAMTPDEDFILDRLPGYRNVVVGAGFSGHGFKFAPLVGELLASLILEEQPEFQLERFALGRFSAQESQQVSRFFRII